MGTPRGFLRPRTVVNEYNGDFSPTDRKPSVVLRRALVGRTLPAEAFRKVDIPVLMLNGRRTRPTIKIAGLLQGFPNARAGECEGYHHPTPCQADISAGGPVLQRTMATARRRVPRITATRTFGSASVTRAPMRFAEARCPGTISPCSRILAPPPPTPES